MTASKWATVGVVLVLAIAGLGGRPLWEPDEGRYTAVALEMLHSGDWVHPALHPERPHYTKPPLTYWAVAASLAAFGPHEWAVRLPNGLAFIGTVLCVAGLARRIAPGRAATAAVVYLTAAMPFIAHQFVTTDTLLTLFTTAGVTFFAFAWCSQGYRRRWIAAMWLAFGVAFLTKGPPSLLPLAAVFGSVLIHDGRRGLRQLLSPIGVLLFLAVSGGWFALVVSQQPDLAAYFLRDEFIDRIATGAHHRNPEWYMALMYPPLLVAGMLPWAIAWFRQPRWWHPAWLVRWVRDPWLTLMLLWIGISLFVFMLSRSRLPLYVLPVFPALAVCTARILPASFPSDRGNRMLPAAAVGMALIATGAPLVVEGGRDARRMTEELGLTPNVAEVVYVDIHPRYGIGFYSGLPIEDVALLTASKPGHHSFELELAEGEGRLAFVTGTQEADTLRQALREARWRIIDEIAFRRNEIRIIAEPEPSFEAPAEPRHGLGESHCRVSDPGASARAGACDAGAG